MYAVRKLGTNWGVPPLDRLIQAHKVFVLSSILNITELGDYKVGRGKILKCVHKSLEILIFDLAKKIFARSKESLHGDDDADDLLTT